MCKHFEGIVLSEEFRNRKNIINYEKVLKIYAAVQRNCLNLFYKHSKFKIRLFIRDV